MTVTSSGSARVWRPGWQLAAGPLLIVFAWPAYWTVSNRYSEDLFLPLWLGYIITVDGLVRLRTGTSLLSGRPRLFLLLLPASCAFWFFYELYNHVLGNWHYRAHQRHPRLVWDIVQGVLITTVIPVVWETRDFFRSFPRLAGARGVRMRVSRRGLRIVFAIGLLSLALPLLFPRQTYPLLWCALFLLLDPFNLRWGRPSLIGDVAEEVGRGRGVGSVGVHRRFLLGVLERRVGRVPVGLRRAVLQLVAAPVRDASARLSRLPPVGLLGLRADGPAVRCRATGREPVSRFRAGRPRAPASAPPRRAPARGYWTHCQLGCVVGWLACEARPRALLGRV